MGKYKQFIDTVKSGKNFLIASHSHPDGDGIGSTIALARGIESLGGKNAVMFNANKVPYNLEFLPGSKEMVTKIPEGMLFDVTILVDCADLKRVGGEAADLTKERTGKVILIDHHEQSGADFDISCVDVTAAAAGEVVYDILKEMGVKITPDVATLILTTFIVDTGSFRYSNTSAKLMRDAAELMDAGASTWRITVELHESDPMAYMKLLRLVLGTFDHSADGKVAWIVLTQQMLDDANAPLDVAEEFINFPRSIKGVEVAILFRELKDGKWKVSFRSKDKVDVQKIAKKFEGGGHSHAAGCSPEGNLAEIKERVFDEVQKHLL